MTGSVALDVVIGLVFIYLLYSLFATVILEILNTLLGLRARNLRYAIRRMLKDEQNKEGWRKVVYKLRNLLLKPAGLSSNLKNHSLFDTFYNQPSIKYLSAGATANKPSYILPHNFSKSLIDALQQNYGLEGIYDKVKTYLEDTDERLNLLDEDKRKEFNQLSQPFRTGDFAKMFSKWIYDKQEFKKAFKALSDDEKLNVINKLYPEQDDFKSYSAYLSYLQESFQGKNLLERIKAGIDFLPEGSDTKKHLESLLRDAQNDLEKFNFLLERWYDDMMERATGWFKRRAQFFLVIIGFVLAIGFNANTLDIINKLSNNPESRQQLVQLAIAYSEELEKQSEKNSDDLPVNDQEKDDQKKQEVNNPETIIDSTTQGTPTKGGLEALAKEREEFEKIQKTKDSLQKVAKGLRADIENAQNIIGTNWHIPDSIKITTASSIVAPVEEGDAVIYTFNAKIETKEKCEKELYDECIEVKLHKSVDITALIKTISPISEKDLNDGYVKVQSGKYKRKYVFERDGLNFPNLWGYLLTALAISMGSPFWFDLLNKLVNLRNSIKPQQEEKREPNKREGAKLIDRVG